MRALLLPSFPPPVYALPVRTLVSAASIVIVLAAAARGQEVTFGSNPRETLEASAVLFGAEIKSRSHFGFDEHGSRNGELAFVEDLGMPSTVPAIGLQGAVNGGELGWLGGEVLGFEDEGDRAFLSRERQQGNITFQPLDLIEGGARVIWGGLHYGYEVRVRLFDALDLAASPTLGFGWFDVEAKAQRLFPQFTTVLGGHATAFVITPGARLQVEAFELVRVGADLETGLTGLRFAVSTPHVELWDRVRVFVGFNYLGIDATFGWRLAATHIEGDGKAVDLRLRGFDASLGVRF